MDRLHSNTTLVTAGCTVLKPGVWGTGREVFLKIGRKETVKLVSLRVNNIGRGVKPV